MSNNKPKVILLVAGEGKRLHPYTLDKPKCMVQIDGISLIDRQLAVLKAEGLNDIVMIGGYKSEMLARDGIKLKNNPRYFETNMVWTLFCAEEELEGEVIISYGDIVYSRHVLQALLKSTADIAVAIDKGWKDYWSSRSDNLLDDVETLKLCKDGTISEIGQKPKSLEEIEGQYMGLMKFEPKGWNSFKECLKKDFNSDFDNLYLTDVFQKLIEKMFFIKASKYDRKWAEVDSKKDYLVMKKIFKD